MFTIPLACPQCGSNQVAKDFYPDQPFVFRCARCSYRKKVADPEEEPYVFPMDHDDLVGVWNEHCRERAKYIFIRMEEIYEHPRALEVVAKLCEMIIEGKAEKMSERYAFAVQERFLLLLHDLEFMPEMRQAVPFQMAAPMLRNKRHPR